MLGAVERGATSDLAHDRSVHVAGNDPLHIRVRATTAAKLPCLRCDPDAVEGQKPGGERGVVQRDHDRRTGIRRELGLEPVELLGVKLAAVPAGNRAVEHEEPDRPDARGVADRLGAGAREIELAAKERAVVVIAPAARTAELRRGSRSSRTAAYWESAPSCARSPEIRTAPGRGRIERTASIATASQESGSPLGQVAPMCGSLSCTSTNGSVIVQA